MSIQNDELLRAWRLGEITVHDCPACHGSGTKFNGTGKSSTCPRCKGKRKLVRIPRDPHEEPYSTEWANFFAPFEKPKHKAKGK